MDFEDVIYNEWLGQVWVRGNEFLISPFRILYPSPVRSHP